MTLIASILSWIPPWIVGAAIMIVPALIVLVIYRWFTRRLIRLAGRFSPFLQRLLSRGQGPASVIVLIIALGIALPAADFPRPVTIAIGRALLVGFVLALALAIGFFVWSEPACAQWMLRLVPRPVPMLARPSRGRFLSSALPWWWYSIMAPPRPLSPTQSRCSGRFRRDG